MDKIIRMTMPICLCVFIGCVEVEEADPYVPEVPENPCIIETTSTSANISPNTPIDYLKIGMEPDLSDAVKYYSYNRDLFLSGLHPYTTYYYQSVKRNPVGTELRSKIESFTTNIKLSITEISSSYAAANNIVTLSAEIPSGSSANVLEYGFCISQTSKMPTLETSDAIVIKATGLPSSIDGKYSYTFSGQSNGSQLKKGLISYVRSYIKTEKNISYSENNWHFFPVSGIKQNRAYVDLGLPSGTLWTAANYSGKAYLALPTDHFNYFEENYYSADFGIFRMPTFADAKELYENCTYNKVKINNTYCAQITSKINGNAIYIPFGGLGNSGGYIYNVGEYGSIWLNTLTNDGFWRQIYFSDESEIGYTYYSYHGYRRNIRLVLDD